jgi:hypothetical protein
MKNKKIIVRFIQNNRWYFVAALWVIGLALGYTGYGQYAASSGESYTWLDRLFGTVQLIFLEYSAGPHPPLQLNIARFLLPFLTAQTGLMALAGIFNKEARRLALRFSRGHIILCGDGDLALFAARVLQKGEGRLAWITNHVDQNEIREVVEAGGVVTTGSFASKDTREKAAFHKATYLLLFDDDDNKNIENALLADRISAGARRNTLQCITHMYDPMLSSLFLEKMLKTEWTPAISHDVINIYEQAAHLVLEKYPVARISSGETTPFLIIGFGRFGQHLLLETARILAGEAQTRDLNIYILDREANWKCMALKKRYPQLEEVCCIHTHEMDIYSPAFQDTKRFLDENCPGVKQVYICLDDDLQAMNTALTIYRQMEEDTPQLILRLSQASVVKDLLQYSGKIEQISAVPIFDEIGSPAVLLNSSVELLARAFHEHYLGQRLAAGADGPAVVSWPELSEEKRESNRNLARYLKRHLGQIGYHLIPQEGLASKPFTFSNDEIDILARKEHERWSAEMRADGWHYGLQANPKKKTNPDLQPWEKLTDAEKQFNRELVRVLPELVASVRLQITTQESDV